MNGHYEYPMILFGELRHQGYNALSQYLDFIKWNMFSTTSITIQLARKVAGVPNYPQTHLSKSLSGRVYTTIWHYTIQIFVKTV